MAVRPLTRFVERLRNVLLQQEGAGTDADLLDRFVRHKDEAAFEALVGRHGPMVIGVCDRILHNSHDAEDAFQATFLVLVRKAASVRPQGMVGNWLYGVAYRTAQEARKAAAKRRTKEASMVPRTETSKDTWDDLLPVLDRELERLPEKYRAVIVHCDLEGKTRRVVAEQLGWPEGTVAGRLATARTMLGKRLARLGLGVSGCVLATMPGQKAPACVSPTVVSATVKAAKLFAAGQLATGAISVEVATLMKGVLKSMLLTKLKMAAAVLVMMAIILGGGGLLTLATFGAGQVEAPEEAQSKEQEKQTNRKDEVRDAEAEATLGQAKAAFQVAEANLRQAQAAVPDAAARLRLEELRHGLGELRADLLLLALELEKQKGRVRLLKERLEYVLMRVEGNKEEKKALAAVMRRDLDQLIEGTVDAAERIEVLRESNDGMLGHLAKGKQGTHLQRLQQVRKEIQGQKEYSDWPERELARARERLVFFRGGFGREFKNAELKDEDKRFLLDTLNKEIDPIIAKADEINGILGRVRVALLKSLHDEKEGTKEDE